MEKLLTDIECKELNKFGKLELTASQAYLKLANRMKMLGYFGAESFFMNDLNCEISVEPLGAPDCDCQDIKSALEMAYQMEKDLMIAYETSAKREDLSLKVVLLLQEFTTHQVGAVGEYLDLIARLALTDNMLLFDQELGK